MENNKNDGKEKRIYDISGLIQGIKDNTEIVQISIDKGIIYVPVYYSMSVQKKYFESYDKYKDYRKAFCSLVLSMINNNMAQVDQVVKNIELNDIEKFDDRYLIKILEVTVKQSDDLTEYYNKNVIDDYFERFYHAIEYEKDKYMDHLKNMSEIITSSLKGTIETMSKIYEVFQPYVNYISDYANNLVKCIQSSEVFNKIPELVLAMNDLKEKLPKRIKNVNIELLKFSWYTFGEFSIPDINDLYYVIEEYKKSNNINDYKNNVNRIMNDFIDNESDYIIQKTFQLFPTHKNIINDAYDAHKKELYTLSIPIFLIQADGICNEILGVSLYSKIHNKPKTKDKIKGFLEKNDIDPETDNIEYLLIYHPLELLSSLAINTEDIDEKYNNNEIYSRFNRHGIIHGNDITYGNRTNSNKCISILAYLCDLKKQIDYHEENK
ncbi:hypothetical protein AB8U03_05515 [Clostridium sp. Mt-5]|uniref:Uncharacterized protein n=1 Tax=Clostridium moutaii TaxID=3240932 RepID=A0ABV4BS85_9CLOT